jgi:Uma2 family endonuclease
VTTASRFTSKDLDSFPEIEGVRYEIIDGELFVSRAPVGGHGFTCASITSVLHVWSVATGLGMTVVDPGLVFAEDQDVIPDLMWISRSLVRAARDGKGHFRLAPELVVEVLSPGRANEVRDRELKLSLYSRRDVQEYWIADWQAHRLEVYRRWDGALQLTATLTDGDELKSPLLPGFSCPVSSLWPPAELLEE